VAGFAMAWNGEFDGSHTGIPTAFAVAISAVGTIWARVPARYSADTVCLSPPLHTWCVFNVSYPEEHRMR